LTATWSSLLTTGTQYQLGTADPFLGSGESTTLAVTFDPTSTGLKLDTVTISYRNDDSDRDGDFDRNDDSDADRHRDGNRHLDQRLPRRRRPRHANRPHGRSPAPALLLRVSR
jgi:hypothetical protein